MKDMSDCNKNNNQDVNLKEEKLFRAMSGVDEDLLLRSGQIRNSGRVHKFPMRYVTRIAAACLCFVVAGVLYMTMSSTKMADSTGNADTAAPQMAYGITDPGRGGGCCPVGGYSRNRERDPGSGGNGGRGGCYAGG